MTNIEDHNFLVGFLYKIDRTHYRYNCIGSIVSPWKILTAGHCLENKSSISLIFGTLDLKKPHQIKLNISSEQFVIHLDYIGNPQFKNDIAVIEMKKALIFEQKIGIIGMVEEGFIPKTGDTVQIFG